MAEVRTVITEKEFKAMSPEGRLRVRLLCVLGEWEISENKPLNT
jgi:hypothetical protein